MSEKLCVFCKHLDLELASDYYGYCGNNDLTCMKKHDLSPEVKRYGISKIPVSKIYDIADFRKAILTAKDCPDYELAEDNKEDEL